MVDEPYIKPRWLSVFTDIVRPGGIALMFCFITVLPLVFAIIELGVKGAGARLAGVLAGYFQAVPDTYYSTIQVLFVAFVAGKSGEAIATSIKGAAPPVNIPSDTTTVNIGPQANGTPDQKPI
jgi:hypothetical protein